MVVVEGEGGTNRSLEVVDSEVGREVTEPVSPSECRLQEEN